MIGDDYDLELVSWIFLIKKFIDGVDDDRVLVIGGKEYEKASLAVVKCRRMGGGKVVFLVEE